MDNYLEEAQMAEFKRARSEEQKEQRMQQIKDAADSLFSHTPYHSITLTTIADELSLTRANLYLYVSTKEEIFLELCADKRDDYYDALLAAFPEGSNYSPAVMAEIWAEILFAHRDYLRYSGLLPEIIETNVSVPRLGAFKRRYYENTYALCDRLGGLTSLSRDEMYEVFLNIHYHAIGIDSICSGNPLVREAMEREHLTAPAVDFRANLKRFILMNLRAYMQHED